MIDSGRDGPPVWALVPSALAPTALIGGWLVAGALQPAGRYDPVRQTISVLAGHGATDRWVMAGCLALVGVCHLVTAAGRRGAARPARLALVVGGLGGIGLAVFAEPRHGSNDVHLAFTGIGLVAMAVFPAVLTARRSAARDRARPFALRPAGAVLAGVLAFGLLLWLVLALHGRTLGLAERALTAQQTVWPLLAVLALRHAARAAATPAAGRSGAPADGEKSEAAGRMVR